MKSFFLILYNQININYFDTSLSKYFLYIHHNWNIRFNDENLNLNIKSRIFDYAMWYNFIEELNNKWFSWDFKVSNSYYNEVLDFCNKWWFSKVYVIKPVENYVYKNFLKIKDKLASNNIDLIFLEDKQSFYLSHNEFLSKYKKPPVMETFYRNMRKKFDILMDWNNPIWWKWNYDKDNRGFDKNRFVWKRRCNSKRHTFWKICKCNFWSSNLFKSKNSFRLSRW